MHSSASALSSTITWSGHPVAIASMARIVDARYVSTGKAHAGGCVHRRDTQLTGPTMDAAREIAAGGERREFLYDDPAAALRAEIDLYLRRAMSVHRI